MVINLNNLFNSINKNSKMGDFQDLDHLDGVSVSTTCANLYSKKRDDIVLFYFTLEMEPLMLQFILNQN